MRIYKFSLWNFNVHYHSSCLNLCVNFTEYITQQSRLHFHMYQPYRRSCKLSCSNFPLLCRNLHVIKSMDKFQYFGFIERFVENNPCTRLSMFHSQYAQEDSPCTVCMYSTYRIVTLSKQHQYSNSVIQHLKEQKGKILSGLFWMLGIVS